MQEDTGAYKYSDELAIEKATKIIRNFGILNVMNYATGINVEPEKLQLLSDNIEGIQAQLTKLSQDVMENSNNDEFKAVIQDMQKVIDDVKKEISIGLGTKQVTITKEALEKILKDKQDYMNKIVYLQLLDIKNSPTNNQNASTNLDASTAPHESNLATRLNSLAQTASATPDATSHDASVKSSSILDTLKDKTRWLYHKFDTQKEQDVHNILRNAAVLDALINIYKNTEGVNSAENNLENLQQKADYLAKGMEELKKTKVRWRNLSTI